MEYSIFCINLERRSDRKAFFAQQGNQVGLQNVRFVNAVDGSDKTSITNMMAELKLQLSSELSSSEQGCLLSHVHIWNKMINQDIKLALILEDDACFVKSFVDNVTQLLKECPQVSNPFILFCGHVDTSTASLQPVDNVTIVNMKTSCPTHCYIISKAAAIIMMDIMQRQNITLALDQYIFTKYDSLPLLRSSKSICHQNYSYSSDIQPDDWNELKLKYYMSNGFPRSLIFSDKQM